MNANRLHDVVKFLVDLENELGLQKRLNAFSSALANLAEGPSDPSRQTALANSLQALGEGFQALKSRVTPAQAALVAEIGGSEFFDPYFADRIKRAIQENPMSPA